MPDMGKCIFVPAPMHQAHQSLASVTFDSGHTIWQKEEGRCLVRVRIVDHRGGVVDVRERREEAERLPERRSIRSWGEGTSRGRSVLFSAGLRCARSKSAKMTDLGPHHQQLRADRGKVWSCGSPQHEKKQEVGEDRRPQRTQRARHAVVRHCAVRGGSGWPELPQRGGLPPARGKACPPFSSFVRS